MMGKLYGLIITLTILFWVFIPGVSLAQNSFEHLGKEQIQELIEIRHSIATIDELQQRGILSEKQADIERERYLEKSQLVLGERVDLEQLVILTDSYEISKPGEQPGVRNISGFFTFVNIVWTLAAILLAIALAWLTWLYLIPILKLIPAFVYEILIYWACLVFIVGGHWFAKGIDEFIALPGCLGLIGALGLTNKLHEKALAKVYFSEDSKPRINPYSLNIFILFIFWSVTAVVYQSSLIGFMAVIALEAFLGFSVIVMPLCYAIGFSNKEVIPRAMSASLLLLVFYVCVQITEVELPYIGIFSTGVLFMGSFVYFIGTLIVSTKWYDMPFNLNRYIGLQVLTIVSGVLALYVGSVWNILLLQRIGGTFFFLYLIEKYFELPWQKEAWAWATLGFAIILYLSALFAKQYPQYFFLVK
ncbi:MAG: hypothetical protein AB4426_20040 [Xenococcaceae cyanobacterium]